MFKLIGLIVVVAVLVIGYPVLQRWYAGDTTPKEAVNEVRNKIGDAISTDKGAAPGAADQAAGGAQADKGGQPTSANQLMKEMMKD